MSTESTIDLVCLPLDFSVPRVGIIKARPGSPIGALKKPIYDAWQNQYGREGAGFANLLLYKIPDLEAQPQPNARTRAKERIRPEHALNDLVPIKSIFPEQPPVREIHIIATLLEVQPSFKRPRSPAIYEDFDKRVKISLSEGLHAAAPSQASKASNIHSQQQRFPIYYGQPNNCSGPPIAVYSDIFVDLKTKLSNLEDIEVTATDLELAEKIGDTWAKVCSEEGDLRARMREHMQNLCGFRICEEYNVDGSKADGAIAVERDEVFSSIISLLEWKLRGGGSDGVYQVMCTYRKLVVSSDYRTFRNSCCCPCLLISIIGDTICIMGAINTDVVVVEELSDHLILGPNNSREERIFRIARIFKAIRSSLLALKQFYLDLPLLTQYSRKLILPRPVVETEEQPPSAPISFMGRVFVEKSELWRPIYYAKMDGKDVVVKFTKRYCRKAHERLQAHALAPTLQYCGRIRGGLWMVVMDRVVAETAQSYFNGQRLESEVLDDVKVAIQLLHKNNLVFGNLRASNILVVRKKKTGTNDGVFWALSDVDIGAHRLQEQFEGECEYRIGAILIDFDWSGEESIARYPAALAMAGMSTAFGQVVERNGLIKKEHDWYQFEQLGN